MLHKCSESGNDPYMALLHLRTTPKENLPSPAELLMSRNLRTKLPSVAKNFIPKLIDDKLYKKQLNNKILKSAENYNVNTKNREKIKPGDKIMFKKYPTSLWFHGEVTENCEEPRSHIVRDDEGAHYRRNEQHIFNKPIPLTSSAVENNVKVENETVNINKQNVNSDYVTRSGRKVVQTKKFDC